MQACHADSLHHGGLMWRDRSCQNAGAAVSSYRGQIGKKKKNPQRHTLSWLCANLLNAWKNTGNPVLYHTLKRKEIWFTLVNQRQHSDRGLTGINGSRRTMSPRHHNKSFSLLHRQTHPHDVLGWAEEFPSPSYKYFSMNTVRPVADDVIKMNSVTLKYASFFLLPSKQAVTTYHKR